MEIRFIHRRPGDQKDQNSTGDQELLFHVQIWTYQPLHARSQTRDIEVQQETGRAAGQLQLSEVCECVRITRSLAEHWAHADAVLYMRLSESEPVVSTPQGYYRHSANVLTAMKEPKRDRAGPVFVIQNQRSGATGPYDIGQELVAFLEIAGADTFRVTNDEPGLAVAGESHGVAMAFLVKDGRIQRAPAEFNRYVGMPIAVFLAELRTLSGPR